jgi:hypothetical protein
MGPVTAGRSTRFSASSATKLEMSLHMYIMVCRTRACSAKCHLRKSIRHGDMVALKCNQYGQSTLEVRRNYTRLRRRGILDELSIISPWAPMRNHGLDYRHGNLAIDLPLTELPVLWAVRSVQYLLID